MAKVLVTGGKGFIAAHSLIQLLQAGHETRTTLRTLAREADVRSMLRRGGAGEVGGRVEFFQADLNGDNGWPAAAAGCDFVLHVASPFPATTPKDENELIIPARDGALRVLRAARDAGVKRVVMTSSFAAIGYGHQERTTEFTEKDWSNLNDKELRPYPKSKTIAERAAWDFIEREGRGLELAVVNPVAVLGPVLSADFSPSILLVKRLMDGSVPGCPDLSFGIVDVRDVALLHLRAMTNPAARGERFLATAGDFLSFIELAKILKEKGGNAARKVPTRVLPNWLLRVMGIFDAEVRGLIPELGKRKQGSNAKARRVLGWTPITPEESVLETAKSLVELGVIKAG